MWWYMPLTHLGSSAWPCVEEQGVERQDAGTKAMSGVPVFFLLYCFAFAFPFPPDLSEAWLVCFLLSFFGFAAGCFSAGCSESAAFFSGDFLASLAFCIGFRLGPSLNSRNLLGTSLGGQWLLLDSVSAVSCWGSSSRRTISLSVIRSLLTF